MKKDLLLPDLPEDIIYRLLSHLTNEETLRLSQVSKSLLNVVQKRPNLVFDPRLKKYDQKELKCIIPTLRRYHKDNLKAFTLNPNFVRKNLHDQCIELALAKGVRNLNIQIDCKSVYCLPQSIFEAESLVELELKNCHIDPKRRVVWPNLKRLKIEGCGINHEDAYQNMISGCPNVEDLTVHNQPRIHSSLKIANLRSLKQLDMRISCGGLEVMNTPNLESLICTTDVIVLSDSEYPNLRSLEVNFRGIEEQKHFFTNFGRKFPILEKLSFNCSSLIQRINISSASLKELKMSGFEFEDVCLDVPNLVSFEFHNDKIPKLLFRCNPSGWISSCIELTYMEDSIDTWFHKLIEFLAALNKSETSLTVRLDGQNKLDLNQEQQKLIADSITSIPEIRELSLSTFWTKMTRASTVDAILDCMFLICQPRTMTFLGNKKYDLPRRFKKKLISRRDLKYGGVNDFQMFHRTRNLQNRSEEIVRILEVLEDGKVKDQGGVYNDIIFNLEYCSSEQNPIKKKRRLL